MANISQIQVGSITYGICDTELRTSIDNFKNNQWKLHFVEDIEDSAWGDVSAKTIGTNTFSTISNYTIFQKRYYNTSNLSGNALLLQTPQILFTATTSVATTICVGNFVQARATSDIEETLSGHLLYYAPRVTRQRYGDMTRLYSSILDEGTYDYIFNFGFLSGAAASVTFKLAECVFSKSNLTVSESTSSDHLVTKTITFS